METVTLAEAKAQLSRLIALVEAGGEVTITKRGRPVAQIVASKSVPQQFPTLDELRARLPHQDESAGDFIRRLRDTDRY
ncbi:MULTISPECIES: type II toxin-antitoxin system Phd/YefM family antitoxin [Duganella]|uniref:type II toxin-antitoxin system Phd/YefM family antitoxin n=1 Tax=Duganella TaxID=75654 RepID=UPI00159E6F7C